MALVLSTAPYWVNMVEELQVTSIADLLHRLLHLEAASKVEITGHSQEIINEAHYKTENETSSFAWRVPWFLQFPSPSWSLQSKPQKRGLEKMIKE